MTLFKLFLIVEGIMSLITFMCFALDKKLSKKEQNGRIPEIVLLSLTTFFGSIGAFLGMYVLRHKTSFSTKFHFALTTFLSLAVQIGAGVWFFVEGGF